MKRTPHALRWLLEPIEDEPTYFEKPMFGCLAAYLHGRLMLVLADREEPWSGLLVCTDRSVHASLRSELPALAPHPVLGKWLYLPQTEEDFEAVSADLVELVRVNDARLGVEPRERPSRKRKRKSGTQKRKGG